MEKTQYIYLLWQTQQFEKFPADLLHFTLLYEENATLIQSLINESDKVRQKYLTKDNEVAKPLVTFMKGFRRGVYIYVLDKTNTMRFIAESPKLKYVELPQQNFKERVDELAAKRQQWQKALRSPEEKNWTVVQHLSPSEISPYSDKSYKVSSKKYPHLKFIAKSEVVIDQDRNLVLVSEWLVKKEKL